MIIVSVLVMSLCCWVYREDLTQGHPIVYNNDGLAVLSRVKAYAQGELGLIYPQFVSRLNAPFSAVWSDYPSDKLSFYTAGILVRFFGLANGSTLCVIFLQAVCGLCFLAATRLMGFMRVPSIACSILFGIAPYAFCRNLNHLNLLFYGLLPLQTVILVKLMTHQSEVRSRSWMGIMVAVSLVAGLFNPYYLLWYLGFLLLLTASNLAYKNWQFAMAGLAGMAAGVGGFIFQNLDSLLMRRQFGVNSAAVYRSYNDLAKYALTLPDLFFPAAHAWGWLQSLSWNLYFSKVPEFFYSENHSPYLGLVAAIAFTWMMVEGLFRIIQNRSEKANPLFWLTSGVLALGLVGGVNYLIGAFGFYLLRSTNRYSIVLSAISLLFLCEKLSSKRLGGWRMPLVVLLLMLGVWDQMPIDGGKAPQERQAEIRNYLNDGELFKHMEHELPAGAMVFQLPVHFYPELGPVGEMGDYEHFRPYLQTDHLRFSYGTIKGRDDTWWQYEVEKMPPSLMVSELERLGFSALMINRKAYSDHGLDFVNKIAKTGLTPWFDEGDFIAYRLKPIAQPAMPELGNFQTKYSSGFYQEERYQKSTMRWGGKYGEIKIVPPLLISREKKKIEGSCPANFRVTVEAVNPEVKVFARINDGDEQLIVAPGKGSKTINFSVPPRGGGICLRAEGPAAGFPGDPRHDIRFRVIDPEIYK